MKLWEKYLIEGLFFKPEKEEVKELREKGLTVYFYHGTDLRKSGDIKRYGLLPSKQESYVHQAIGDFEKGGKYYGKKFTFLTTSKKYAEEYSIKSRTWIFDFKTYLPLIVRTNGSKVNFFLNFRGADEYGTEFIIPPKDVIFPDNPLYEKIEKKYSYLSL